MVKTLGTVAYLGANALATSHQCLLFSPLEALKAGEATQGPLSPKKAFYSFLEAKNSHFRVLAL